MRKQDFTHQAGAGAGTLCFMVKSRTTGDRSLRRQESDSDNEYIQQTAQQILHHVKKTRSGVNQDTVLIRIGDIDVEVEPDSGASANVMDGYQLEALRHILQEIIELESSRDTLKTLQPDLVVKGNFSVTLQNKNRDQSTSLVMTQGKMDSPPLLSKSTLFDLGMLRIDLPGTLIIKRNQ